MSLFYHLDVRAKLDLERLMGFYIRKSLRFGPLRFNLSKSGLGVSAGVKGFRIGTGPRGNYVHAGAGGFYYRATLPQSRAKRRPPVPARSVISPLAEIESAESLSMGEANSADLLAEINAKRRSLQLWPLVLILGVVLTLVLLSNGGRWIPAAMIIILALPVAYWDARRRTTILFYNLEPPFTQTIETLYNAFRHLQSGACSWHIEAEGPSNRKYNAGANVSVRRKRVHLHVCPPPYLKTNVPVPCIPVGRQKLYFLPDRLLIYDALGVGAVSYGDLYVNGAQTRFVESEGVPPDAQVIDRTWLYSNQSGGPDRRFRANPELPVVLYEEFTIRSASGLNERLQFSMIGSSAPFIHALENFAAVQRDVSYRQGGDTPINRPPLLPSYVFPPPGSNSDRFGAKVFLIVILSLPVVLVLICYLTKTPSSPDARSNAPTLSTATNSERTLLQEHRARDEKERGQSSLTNLTHSDSVDSASLLPRQSAEQGAPDQPAASPPAKWRTLLKNQNIVSELNVIRAPDNGIVISGKVALPPGTRIAVALLKNDFLGRTQVVKECRIQVNEDCLFRSEVFIGRLKQGRHWVRVIARFDDFWQPQDILTLIGEGGALLPREQLTPDFKDFPDSTRHLDVRQQVLFPTEASTQ